MEKNLKKNLSNHNIWLRGLYMLLFVLIYNIVELVTVTVVLFQFVSKLITGKPNARLLTFGQNLCIYIYQIWQFLTFNSEELPFPFAPWPNDTQNRE